MIINRYQITKEYKALHFITRKDYLQYNLKRQFYTKTGYYAVLFMGATCMLIISFVRIL